MKHFLILVLAILGSILLETNGVQAQGWVQGYNQSSANTVGYEVITTPDGAAWFLSTDGVLQQVYLRKVDIDGSLHLEQVLHTGGAPVGISLQRFGLQEFIAFIRYSGSNGQSVTKMLRINRNGNILSENVVAVVGTCTAFDKVLDNTGDYIGSALVGDSSLIFRLNNTGNPVWSKKIGMLPGQTQMLDVFSTTGGDSYANIKTKTAAQVADSSYVVRFSNNGNIIWKRGFMPQNPSLWSIIDAPDGGVVLSIFTAPNKTSIRKLNASGNLVYQTDFPNSTQRIYFPSVVNFDNAGKLFLALFTADNDPQTLFFYKLNNDGTILQSKSQTLSLGKGLFFNGGLAHSNVNGYYLSGRYETDGNQYACLVHADNTGLLYANVITGNVANDINLNCDIDNGEPGLENWLVQWYKPSSADSFYTRTDAQGRFEAVADTGAWQLSIRRPNAYWETCQPSFSLPMPLPYDTSSIGTGAQSVFDCPLLEVNIATPYLRQCVNNVFQVRYCNNGTIPAPNATIEIDFDPAFDFVSASVPSVLVTPKKLNILIGAVQAGECGAFALVLHADCDSTSLGSTLCVQSRITPDSICLPPDGQWSGASVALQADCETDSVRFEIRNIGTGNMSQALDYVIIEDEIILLQGQFNLPTGEATIIRTPANGSTWRMEAEQEPFHPGFSMPSITIEGCGTNPQGLQSLGFVTQFGEDDGNPFLSEYCTEVIGSFDPNDMIAIPKGVGNQHFISPTTPLEYTIRFQNTGTDTAFMVIIRDTIPLGLDMQTFEPLISDHSFRTEFAAGRVVKFIFDQILLPDSNINEPASHGFVQYRVFPEKNLPLPTVIHNRAGIYFDFNEPVMTNSVFHTIDTNYLENQSIAIINPPSEDMPFSVYPNPAVAGASLHFSENVLDTMQFTLMDVYGHRKTLLAAQRKSISLPTDLPSGIYLLEARNKHKIFGIARLFVH